MDFPKVKRRLMKALLLFSLCVLCFSYGMVAGLYKVFPFPILRDAWTATQAIDEARQESPNAGLETYKRIVDSPTATQFAPEVGEELLLVGGGAAYLQDYHEAGCLAWLMDRTGKVKHIWKYDPSVWHDLRQVAQVPTVSGPAYPVGMHLFDDGGLAGHLPRVEHISLCRRNRSIRCEFATDCGAKSS